MAQRRLEKMNELLKEAIALLLLNKSKDPRHRAVSVTAVKVSPDLRKAVVFYSLLGGAEARAEARRALEGAKGFVRAAVGETLGLKYTPEIKFEFDRNLEYAQHMAEVLNQIGRREGGAGEDMAEDGGR